jgi:hypothetical protein
MQEKVRDQGDQTNRRRPRPHWRGDDEQGYDDGVDKKKKQRNNNNIKPCGIFTQWAEQYNMGNQVKPKEFPRVDFWTDTNWEPYKEGIQQEIRRQQTTDGKDFADFIETNDRLGLRRRRVDLHGALFPKGTGARQRCGSLQEEDDG